MLVLSRKANQKIVIGENIELTVIAVEGGRVQLGFNAPSEVPIHREEVHQRIQAEEQACGVDSPGSHEVEILLNGRDAKPQRWQSRDTSVC